LKACIDFAPVFAQLSNKYGDLKNFKFAKIDANLYPDVARAHFIDVSALSKQLPTIILFQKCAEVKRRPFVDSKNVVYPFVFSYENMVKEFDLNSVYFECKKSPIVVRPLVKPSDATVNQDDKKQN
jgi:hypothetical protein